MRNACLPGERKEEVTLLREQNCSRQILLIDPDEVFCQVLQQVLGTGYSLRRVATAKAGDSQLDSAETDVVLLNLDLQNGAASSEDLLALVKFIVGAGICSTGDRLRLGHAAEKGGCRFSPGRRGFPRTAARCAGAEVSPGRGLPACRPGPRSGRGPENALLESRRRDFWETASRWRG